MAINLDKFAEVPNSYKYGGLVAFMAVLAGAFWYFIYDPSIIQIKRLETTRNELSKKVTEAEEIAKNLPKFEQETKELRKALEEALKKLPKGREIPNLLEEINKSVIDAGLGISVFQPGGMADKGLYSEFPINITVTGGYHSFAAFTDKMSKLDRIVTVNNITMSPAGEENLSIVAQATTYTSK
jgi:type IV pilus assembly protein PilO